MDIKTTEDLKREYPELTEKIEKDACKNMLNVVHTTPTQISDAAQKISKYFK